MESAATVEKAIDVLFTLHATAEPMGVTRLGEVLGLPKSSVHRLLAALTRRQLVERDSRGRYRTGIGLIALGLGSLRGDPLVLAARPVLEAESEALGETAFLVGLRAGELIVLDKAEGRGFLRAAPTLGARIPLDCTAVGKLLRAFEVSESGSPPGGGVQAFGASDDGVRRRELERIRKLGYAESRAEWIPGLAVVAAPIRASHRIQGALAIGAPSAQMEALGFAQVGRRTARAAAEIECRLQGDLQ